MASQYSSQTNPQQVSGIMRISDLKNSPLSPDQFNGEARLGELVIDINSPASRASPKLYIGNIAGNLIELAAPVISVAGPNGAVQFNNNGALGGSNGFLWDGANLVITGNVQVNGLVTDDSFSPNGAFTANEIISNGNMIANGNAYFNGDTYQNGNMYINGDTLYTGNTIFNGNVLYTSDITTQGNVVNEGTVINNSTTILNGTTISNGNMLLNGDTYANGNTYMNGDLISNGNVVTNGTVTNNGDVYNTGNTYLEGDTYSNGTSYFQGDIVSNGDMITNGNVFNNSTVYNNANTISNGTSFFNGDIVSNGNLITNGEVINNGNVFNNSDVYNNANMYIEGDTYSNGNVFIDGTITSNGDITSNGNMTAGGNLAVDGNITANGDVTILGTTTVNNLEVTGSANLGNVSNLTILGGSNGQILTTFGNGTVYWSNGPDASKIANGTSNVQVNANGNVDISIAGVADLVVFSSGGVNAQGYITALGNITGANFNTSGVVTATGNITTDANLITDTVISRTGDITLRGTGADGDIVLFPGGTGSVEVSNALISNVANPVNAQDAATKAYVDGVAQGLTVLSPVVAASTGNLAGTYNNGAAGVGATITLATSLLALDGVGLAAGDRVLVKNQTAAAQNGIYVYTSSTVLTRSTDFDISTEMVGGEFVFVSSGFVNGGSGWVQKNTVATVGTSPVSFEQFSSAGSYSAGVGLQLSGGEFSVKSTGVVANTYGNASYVPTFTVNPQGQLTAATQNPVIAFANTMYGPNLDGNVLYSQLRRVGNLEYLNVDGNITSTGNLQVLNANLGNLATAAFFQGDGSLLTNLPSGNRLINGNSNVTVLANGNVTVGVAGTTNVVQISNTRMLVDGNITATGNLAADNFTLSGNAAVTGNITTNAGIISNNITSRTGDLYLTAIGAEGDIFLQPSGTGIIDAANSMISNLRLPSVGSDATNKEYVDAVATGLEIRAPARVATTDSLQLLSGGSVTYNNGAAGVGATLQLGIGLAAIDGVTLVNGDRVVVKDQPNATQNGVYVRTSPTVFTRATDFDTASEMPGGEYVFVTEGTIWGGTSLVQTSAVAAVGSTAVSFVQFNSPGTYSVGVGLVLTGTQFSLGNTGVTPGNYGNGSALPSITVDAQGRIQSVTTNPVAANAANLSGDTMSSNVIYSNLVTLGNLQNLTIVGPLNVTGDSTLGNVVTANYFVGNVTGPLANGTSNVAIPTADGNVAVSVNGVANVFSVSQNAATLLGNITVTANATVGGNLVVAGGNTFLNTDVLTTEARMINLGGSANGGAPATDDNRDRGAVMQYNSGGALTAFMGWDDSAQEFALGSNVSVAADVVTFNQYGNLRAGTFLGSAELVNLAVSGESNLGSVGNLVILGGNAGETLITDGTGNVFWGTPTGNIPARIANGTSNVDIAVANGDVTLSANGVANIVTVSSNGVSGATTVTGNLFVLNSTLFLGTGAAGNANGISLGVNAGNSGQGTDAIRIGSNAGAQSSGYQNTLAVGSSAGEIEQGNRATALGVVAGQQSQGTSAAAVGDGAGRYNQSTFAVALGAGAGSNAQGAQSVAIGRLAGNNIQGTDAVAIGNLAGGNAQGSNAVAIGTGAGSNTQGARAVAIGANSGAVAQAANSVAIGQDVGSNNHVNTIMLNASDAALTSTVANSFYVAPVRNDATNNSNVLMYNTTTKEVTYASLNSIVSSNSISNGTSNVVIPAANGAVRVGANGLANVVVIENDSANLSVYMRVAGNLETVSDYIKLGNLANAGQYGVAIGTQATANTYSVSVGYSAGNSQQKSNAVAIGTNAGTSQQDGNTVAIGNDAGRVLQKTGAVAIGAAAGNNQSAYGIALGYSAAANAQGTQAIAIGNSAAANAQGAGAVAIGAAAGNAAQGANAIALGSNAASNAQATSAIAMGVDAAANTQGANAIAIGTGAAADTQGTGAIAIGDLAGAATQGARSIAIGLNAGRNNLTTHSVAIGANAVIGSAANNILALNATGANLFANTANAFYVRPVRNDVTNTGNLMFYNDVTGEISYAAANIVTATVSRVANGTSNVEVATANSNITLGVGGTANVFNIGADTTTVRGNILPSTSNTYNLGSSTARWANLFLSNNSLYIGAVHITSDDIDTVNIPRGNLGNLSVVGNLTAANASITNLIIANSTFTALNVTDDANVANLRANGIANLGAVGNVRISGGSNGQVLTTNGSGNLSWVTISTSSISNGNSNVTVTANGNVNTSAGGNANVFVVTPNGANITGTLGVSNTANFAGDLNVSGNTIITGNLTVNGNTNFINVSGLQVEDPMIEVGGGPNGANLIVNDGKDRGLQMHYYTTAPVDAFMGWDNSNSEFAFGSNVTVANDVATFNQLGNVRASTYIGNGAFTDLGVTGIANLGAIANIRIANGTAGQTLTAHGNGAVYWSTAGAPTSVVNGNSNIVINPSGNILVSVTGVANTAVFSNDRVTVTQLEITNTKIALGAQSAAGDNSVSVGNLAGNTTQGANAVAIGYEAGTSSQGAQSVAIGREAGKTNQAAQAVAVGLQAGITAQGSGAVAVGAFAGNSTQGSQAVAIGYNAAKDTQSARSVAIGNAAGQTSQSTDAVAIGSGAGTTNQRSNAVAVGGIAGSASQGNHAVAVGYSAGNSAQGNFAVAIGSRAGANAQGLYSIAIGANAGHNAQSNNSIVINASGANLTAAQANSLYIDPIRTDATNNTNLVFYNVTTKEVTYAPVSGLSIASNRIVDDLSGTTKVEVWGVNTEERISGTVGGELGMWVDARRTHFGYGAGRNVTTQTYGVYIGTFAASGNTALGESIAIGYSAALNNQGWYSIAIGSEAANNQGNNAIAIGRRAGGNAQGTRSTVIGHEAVSAFANSVVLGAGIAATGADQLHIGPIREDANAAATRMALYRGANSEIVQSTPSAIYNGNTRINIADSSSDLVFRNGANSNVLTMANTGFTFATAVNLGAVANVRITGGSNGHIMGTDGAGNLSFVSPGTLTVNSANFANFAGNVTLASQPNITSVGTLTGLSVSGVSNLNAIGNVIITGGANGQVLSTNGSGNLSWITISSSSITNGNSNVVVTANSNVNISVAGTANVLVVTQTGANVAGTVTATGNISGANLVASAGANVTGNLSAGNITSGGTITGATITATALANLGPVANVRITGGSAGQALTTNGSGNLSWSNIATTSLVNGNSNVVVDANANITVGSAGTANVLVIGNTGITVANTVTAGNVTVSGVSTLGAVANVRITGGSNGQVLTTNGSGNLSWAGVTSIANGNSNIVIDANSNIRMGSTGTANVLVVSSTGAAVTGNITVSGVSNLGAVANVRITGGSNGQLLRTDGAGNLTFGLPSISFIENGQSNVSIATANSSVKTFVAGSEKLDVSATTVTVSNASVILGNTSSTLTWGASDTTILGSRYIQTGSARKLQWATESVTINSSNTANIAFANANANAIQFWQSTSSNVNVNFTDLDSTLGVGGSLTSTILITQGATPYIPIISITGSTSNVLWVSGFVPTATANCVQAYTYTFIKTAANVYTILGQSTVYGL